MKKFLLKIPYFLLTIVFANLTACKKSGSDAPNVHDAFSATLNGNSFQTSTVEGLDMTSISTFDIVATQHSGNDSTVIELSFPDTLAINKTYDIGGGHSGGAFGTFYNGGMWYLTMYRLGVSGSITLTSLDKNNHFVAGSFTGVAKSTAGDSIVLNNGKFSSNFQVQ